MVQCADAEALLRVVQAWPSLPATVRSAILSLAEMGEPAAPPS
jgi:hypothetical protein